MACPRPRENRTSFLCEMKARLHLRCWSYDLVEEPKIGERKNWNKIFFSTNVGIVVRSSQCSVLPFPSLGFFNHAPFFYFSRFVFFFWLVNFASFTRGEGAKKQEKLRVIGRWAQRDYRLTSEVYTSNLKAVHASYMTGVDQVRLASRMQLFTGQRLARNSPVRYNTPPPGPPSYSSVRTRN